MEDSSGGEKNLNDDQCSLFELVEVRTRSFAYSQGSDGGTMDTLGGLH